MRLEVDAEVARYLRVQQQRVDLAPHEGIGDVICAGRHRGPRAEAVLDLVHELEPARHCMFEQHLADRPLQGLVAAVSGTRARVQLDNRRRRVLHTRPNHRQGLRLAGQQYQAVAVPHVVDDLVRDRLRVLGPDVLGDLLVAECRPPPVGTLCSRWDGFPTASCSVGSGTSES